VTRQSSTDRHRIRGEVYFTDDVVQKLESIVNRLESVIKEVAIVDYAVDVA
jgi:hypothetical protein